MNTSTLLAASPETISSEMFNWTMSRAGKASFISSFNNVIFLRRETAPATEVETSEVYFFRGTVFAAKGIAKGGFNVYHVEGDLFTARRAKTFIVES